MPLERAVSIGGGSPTTTEIESTAQDGKHEADCFRLQYWSLDPTLQHFRSRTTGGLR